MAHQQPCGSHQGPPEPSANPHLEVADILRRYGRSYAQSHSVSPFEQRVIDDLMACRTARLGGHLDHCKQCGFERQAYNSCRNRHCPKCQSITKAKWVEARCAELLPTAYFHSVFTLPHELNPLVLSNKRLLLGMLFQSTTETLLQFGQRNLGGRLGATLVLHTWDQLMQPHFHLHTLIPGGVLSDDGATWIATSPKFLFPVGALREVFREKFLDALRRAYRRQELRWTPSTEHLQSSQSSKGWLNQLYAHNWVVYTKAPFNGPQQTLHYLGRYTHRVAISNHCLVKLSNGRVHFTYRNRKQGDRTQMTQLDAHVFIQRLLWHILPLGFVRIRHCGLLANRCKAQTLPRCREALGQFSEPVPVEPKTTQQ